MKEFTPRLDLLIRYQTEHYDNVSIMTHKSLLGDKALYKIEFSPLIEELLPTNLFSNPQIIIDSKKPAGSDDHHKFGVLETRSIGEPFRARLYR